MSEAGRTYHLTVEYMREEMRDLEGTIESLLNDFAEKHDVKIQGVTLDALEGTGKVTRPVANVRVTISL